MLKSLFGLIEDAGKIVTAPVEIVIEATRAITKPVADAAQELVDEVKDINKD